MARGSDQATGAATSAQTLSNAAAGNAGALYNTVAPELMTESVHPAGFDPTTIAKMNTEAEESAGGSQAGAVGAGGLRAMRTRNAGGADAAIAESTRESGRELSRGVLGTQLANEHLKVQQQQDAQRELGGLYGTSLGSGVNALGEVASNVNANTNEENQSWDWAKYILDPALQAAGSAAKFGHP